MSDTQNDRVVDEFIPESRCLHTDNCSANVPKVHTSYIKTTADTELSDSIRDALIDELDADDVCRIDSGHMPMLSHQNP